MSLWVARIDETLLQCRNEKGKMILFASITIFDYEQTRTIAFPTPVVLMETI